MHNDIARDGNALLLAQHQMINGHTEDHGKHGKLHNVGIPLTAFPLAARRIVHAQLFGKRRLRMPFCRRSLAIIFPTDLLSIRYLRFLSLRLLYTTFVPQKTTCGRKLKFFEYILSRLHGFCMNSGRIAYRVRRKANKRIKTPSGLF